MVRFAKLSDGTWGLASNVRLTEGEIVTVRRRNAGAKEVVGSFVQEAFGSYFYRLAKPKRKKARARSMSLTLTVPDSPAMRRALRYVSNTACYIAELEGSDSQAEAWRTLEAAIDAALEREAFGVEV